MSVTDRWRSASSLERGFETQIEELDEQISHLLHQVNQAITTIPGIGDTLGTIIVSEIDDINRFALRTSWLHLPGWM